MQTTKKLKQKIIQKKTVFLVNRMLLNIEIHFRFIEKHLQRFFRFKNCLLKSSFTFDNTRTQCLLLVLSFQVSRKANVLKKSSSIFSSVIGILLLIKGGCQFCTPQREMGRGHGYHCQGRERAFYPVGGVRAQSEPICCNWPFCKDSFSMPDGVPVEDWAGCCHSFHTNRSA